MSSDTSSFGCSSVLSAGSSVSSDVLERALSGMVQLQEDLQGADSHLVAGSLKLVSGWLHSNASIRVVLRRAATASKEEKQAANQAAAAREAALKDAAVAQDHCKVLEAELQGLRDEHAKEARDR